MSILNNNEKFNQYKNSINELLSSISENQINQSIKLIKKTIKNNGRLYIAGNGGSAADSQHIAAEFVSRLSFDRESLPAESLTTDTSVLTAIGNDYGFENIFSRQITSKVSNNDMFLGITTSGNSKNVVNALKECKKKDSVIISEIDIDKVNNFRASIPSIKLENSF